MKKKLTKKASTHPFKIGEKYLIRTVTNYITGKLEAVYPTELVMSSAAWIADTGRYFDCLSKGTFNEVEPMLDKVIIGRGSIIDCVIWKFALPREQK